jgi:CRISPR-associated protein Csb1
LPRLLESRIDAYGVEKRHRSAQYFAALNFVEAGLLDSNTNKKELDQRSQAGFRDSPSGRQAGGVEVVDGGRIVRAVTLHLSAINRLGAGADKKRGAEVRRYILGLALAVATSPLPLFLRQGCSLVPQEPAAWREVGFDGAEQTVALPHDAVLVYAAAARDRLFGARWKSRDTWTATKARAQAEVKKRAKGDDDPGVTTP